MTQPTHVDGNAVGGLLQDLFGVDMTDRRGRCGQCGTVSRLATLIVYRHAPGDVLRCPNCGTVVMVAVATPTGTRVSFGSLSWIEIETSPAAVSRPAG